MLAFAFPVSYDLIDLFRAGRWIPLYPIEERGGDLVHSDPDHNIFYSWIKNNTKRNAAFIDDKMLIPVLGRRDFFVALDTQFGNYPLASG